MAGHAYTAAPRAPRALERMPRASGPARPLAIAALCVAALAVVWVVAELVPSAHFRDASILYHFTTWSRPGLDSVLEALLSLLNPLPFILWGVALAAFAVAEGRPRVALAVVLVLSLAPLSAEDLKPLLAHSHDRVGWVSVGPASWPSGHSTAATALAMSAVLVSPPRWRRVLSPVAFLFVVAVSVALLVLAWHMPSDVVGGILLGTFWISVAVASLRGAERRWPTRPQGPAPGSAGGQSAPAA